MASLRSISVDASQRARRWDAIVLGSGVASLVAAARLGMNEQRVLVVEERAAAALPVCLREPPLFAGCGDGAVLDQALRELRVPLIDRRRYSPGTVGFQIVGPDLRIDVGEQARTASELVTWALAKPEPAETLVRALDQAADLERELLLASPLVRAPGIRGLARSSAAIGRSRPARGLPPEVADAGPELGRILAAQVRAMGNHAEGGPNSEACARVLGSNLRGGVVGDGTASLIPVLRRRVEALYGEFRSIDSDFEIISSSGFPGLRQRESGELWLARGLVIGSSCRALGHATQDETWARQLSVRAASARRRCTFHWQLPRDMLPEGMADRVILLSEPTAPDPQQGVATLCVTGSTARSRTVDLVVRLLDEQGEAIAANGGHRCGDLSPVHDRIEALLRELMPFAGDALERQTIALPGWDDDDWLEDTPAGTAWPGDASYRVSARPPVYRLDRPAVAALGLEGDLVLGWRAGDAIAAEFS